MRQFFTGLAAAALFAGCLAAQEPVKHALEQYSVVASASTAEQDAKLQAELQQVVAHAKMVAPMSFVISTPVLGAPYSAEEVTTFTQTLGDGTRIQRANKVLVYRDGQGRTRRESPDAINIADPVTNVTYTLDPKTMTARKLAISVFIGSSSTGADGKIRTEMKLQASGFQPREATAGGAGQIGIVMAAPTTAVAGAVSHVDGAEPIRMQTFDRAVAPPPPPPPPPPAAGDFISAAKGEPLGFQTFDGVAAEGTRRTSTIKAGEIGNDRPIQTVNEVWYAKELQVTVKSARTDPRNGDETVELRNIRRGEPGPDLFQVPASYKLADAGNITDKR
jgi:hypothetical protein